MSEFVPLTYELTPETLVSIVHCIARGTSCIRLLSWHGSKATSMQRQAVLEAMKHSDGKLVGVQFGDNSQSLSSLLGNSRVQTELSHPKQQHWG